MWDFDAERRRRDAEVPTRPDDELQAVAQALALTNALSGLVGRHRKPISVSMDGRTVVLQRSDLSRLTILLGAGSFYLSRLERNSPQTQPEVDLNVVLMTTVESELMRVILGFCDL